MKIFKAAELEALAARILEAAARCKLTTRVALPESRPQVYTVSDAEIVARSLVLSNLMGHDSHGVLRLPQYVQALKVGLVAPQAQSRMLEETPSLALLDGGWGFGQVVAERAINLAIAKAKEGGVGAVGVRNSYHLGQLGQYPLLAAQQDMIGFGVVNNHGAGMWMSPPGGYGRVLSPNPISFAAPVAGRPPLLLDMTCTTLAEGKIQVLRNKGLPIPEGCAQDAQGNPIADAQRFYGPPAGSILPFGGPFAYKAFGLGLMVEALAGALTGAGCSKNVDGRLGNAYFLLALDIARFCPPEQFKAEMAALVEHVKRTPRQPGVEEMLIPGEPEFRTREKRQAEGIPLDETTWQQLQQLAQDLEVTLS